MSSQPSQVSPLDAIKAVIASLKASRRIVLCHPKMESAIRECIEAEGMAGAITVQASNFMKADEVYFIKEPTL